MPTPRGVLWDPDPHTAAKHRVYRRYLDAWFPILLHSPLTADGRGVTYAEGFAGPGEYTDGSPGSPIIALRAALTCLTPPSPSRPARFLLVEDDRSRTEHLKTVVARELRGLDERALATRGLTVDIRSGRCEETLPAMLDDHRVWGKPLLVVLDTWGSAVDFALLRRIGTSRSAEVIVTIQPIHFARFASDPTHFGDRVFGPVVWRDVRGVAASEKATYIRTQYRRVLNEAGFRYTLDFQLADERNNLLYLVYGTNVEKGVEKMKDAIWAVDPYHGVGYRDPRDPVQETLEIQPTPQTGALLRLLAEHLSRVPGGSATVDELRRFVLLETIYKQTQTLAAVRRLLDRKVLRRSGLGRLDGTSVVVLNAQDTLL